MKFSSKVPKKNKSAGFIVSVEFLLVLTLVVLPIMIGLFLVGRKVVLLYLNYVAAVEQPLSRPVVWDSSATAKVVGPVIGYDEFASPLVLYRDATYDPDWSPGVLLGVRPNRFTGVSKVYYTDNACGTVAYVKSPSAALAAAAAGGWPSVGFLYQLQGVNYAVGDGNILYSGDGTGVTVGTISSVWTSQNTDDASPATGGTACDTTGGSEDDLVAATLVADLDDTTDNFTTPFKLAFATVAP